MEPIGKRIGHEQKKKKKANSAERKGAPAVHRGRFNRCFNRLRRRNEGGDLRCLFFPPEWTDMLEEFDKYNCGKSCAKCCNQSRTDDAGGTLRSVNRKNVNRGGRDELNRTGIDCKEGTHGVSSDASLGVQFV